MIAYKLKKHDQQHRPREEDAGKHTTFVKIILSGEQMPVFRTIFIQIFGRKYQQ